MKKAIIVVMCVLALVFVACDLEGLNNPGGNTGNTGNGSGQTEDPGNGSGTGEQGGGSQGGGQSHGGGEVDPSGGSTEPVHDHTFSDVWSHDWTYHWHAATCGHDDVTYAKGTHTYVEGYCSVCGFKEPQVGEAGPAGGLIFHDKGSYSDGWRFLEAAPSDLRVIGGVPTVDPAAAPPEDGVVKRLFAFGDYVNEETGELLFVNGNTAHGADDITKTGLGQGKRNTQMLVAAMGEETYRFYTWAVPEDNEKTTEYAARMCDILVYNGFDDWYLPSKAELNKMYTELHAKGLGDFHTGEIDGYTMSEYEAYWSSSENTSDRYKACAQYFSSGQQTELKYRSDRARIRPLRYF